MEIILNDTEKKFKKWVKQFNKKEKNFIDPVLLIKSMNNFVGINKKTKLPHIFYNFIKEKSFYLINKFNKSNNQQKIDIYENYFEEFYFFVLLKMSRYYYFNY